MSYVETLHAERKIRLARFAQAAANPKPKIKPIPIEYKTRGYGEPRIVLDVVDPVDERAWMLEIEGFVPSHAAGTLRIADILREVGRHFGLNQQELLSARRLGSFAGPRLVSYYLCRRLTRRSFPEIGRRLGGRDHTTILHGHRQIEKRMRADLHLQASVEMLVHILGGDPE